MTPDANAGYANIFVAGLNQAPGGTIDVTGTSTIEGSSTAYADLNNGTVTLGAQLTLDYVTVSGTQINEASGGSLVFDPTVQLTGGAVITGAPITNFDTLEVSGAASLIDDQVTNNAIVQVDAGGTLTLSGTTITGGTINDGTGSTFATAGTIDVIGNSTIAGAGTAQAYLNNGGVTVESGVTLTLNNVTATGTTFADPGTIQIGSGKTLTLAGTDTITGGPFFIFVGSPQAIPNSSSVLFPFVSINDLNTDDPMVTLTIQ